MSKSVRRSRLVPSARQLAPSALMPLVTMIIMVLCGLLCCGALRAEAQTDEATMVLPTPHFTPAPDDPAWLTQSVQLHGHLGPWAVAGVRFGGAARRAVGAAGYFDLHVTCIGPFDHTPNSCFLDGLQLGTGATLGKRNLDWVPAEKIAVEVRNTRTGAKAVVQPTDELLGMLRDMSGRVAAAQQQDQQAEAAHHDHGTHADDDHERHHDAVTAVVEEIAREVAALPDARLLVVGPPKD